MRAGLLVIAGLLAFPTTAYASDPVDPPAESPPLTWRWQRFRAWEYPLTAVALTGAMVLRFGVAPPSADWTGGILFDDWVQDRTAIQSLRARQAVKSMTDVFFYGSMAYRLVDSVLVPTVVWHSSDVAFQMSMIDLESFAFVAITLWASQALFGRERPYAKRCADPAFAATECAADSTEHNRSFYAGHPAVVLTGAGLTCIHHAHLPLYGGGLADRAACGQMIVAAAVTGVGRVVSEQHHASDLIVGYGIGVVAGFLMPELLHYRLKKPPSLTPAAATTAHVRATLVPQIGASELGVGLYGVF
jgi:membrane-associated phospholipid phosphatase